MRDPQGMRRPLLGLRLLPAGVLSLVTVGGATSAILVRHNSTWVSIWLGVTSTAFAAALVDASAVLETRRQFAPARRVVRRRLQQVHRLLVDLVRVVFDDLAALEDSALPEGLRALPDRPIDLRTSLARVYPPRTRQVYLREVQMRLQVLLDELISFTAAGILPDELEQVDQLLKSAPFMLLVRDVLSGDVWLKSNRVSAEQAADLLEKLEALVPK